MQQSRTTVEPATATILGDAAFRAASGLRDRLSRLAPPLAAAAGFGAWAFPLALPWAAVPLVLMAASLISAGARRRTSWLPSVLAAAALLSVLGGVLSPALVVALVAAAVLAFSAWPAGPSVALAVIALQTSYVPTVEALVANGLAAWGLEAAGPGLASAAALLFVGQGRRTIPMLAAVATLAVVAAARYMGAAPGTEMGFAALPGVAAAAILARRGPGSVAGGVVLCALLAASWNITPPRFARPDEVRLLLPVAPNAPEARHFGGLAPALRFAAGLRVVEPEGLETIPEGAFVVLPWLSAPLAEDEAGYAARFRELANTRRWTVVLFGEHDGMGELDARAAALAGRPLFRRDLSVPSGNGDASGPLRAADALAWPHRAVLNRGATTDAYDARARILLAADGWWADPDIGEWLWTGDYRWRPGDRGGRLTLAHAVGDLRGATWVAVGDTSPVLTRQVLGDPRPVLRVMELTTLLPAFLLDIGLLLVGAAVVLLRGGAQARWRRGACVVTVALAITAVAASATPGVRLAVPATWRALNIGEGGFETSNFNAALAAEPELLAAGWGLQRHAQPMSGEFAPPDGPTVSFLLVEGAARLAGVGLSNCRRLGALESGGDGPRLMDAQACRVEGDAEVLVGDRTGAAVLRILGPSGPWVVVLDRGFLAETAPASNAAWLLRTMVGGRGD